jgi:alanine dehydrogenase
MRVGIPREIKPEEYRVAMTPSGVSELIAHGHEVLVESRAGEGSFFSDDEFAAHGAQLLPTRDDVYASAELIVKVKEPQPEEVGLLGPDQTLFAYLHLAADRRLTEGLVTSGATCIAFETVTDDAGRLPLLAPMSEVAGRLATIAGAFMLQRPHGGRGVLIGGVPGVPASKVMIIGGGVAGVNAAKIALGLGAQVYVFDRDLTRLRELDMLFSGRLQTAYASPVAIQQLLPEVDLIIGAVLISGARSPRVLTREQLGVARDQVVVVDISIDQGGCFETSRPTTHASPTFQVDGISHYCVANIPGAVPTTSTRALANATLPFILELADGGLRHAVSENIGLRHGLNVAAGHITHPHVAEALGLPYTPVESVFEA